MDKKTFYITSTILSVIAVAILVYAYGGTDPAVHGHDAGEANLGPLTIDTQNSRVGIGASSPTFKLELVTTDTSATPLDNDALLGPYASEALGIWNDADSSSYTGITMRTRTNGASIWSILNEWQSTYVGDLVFRGRDSGTSSKEVMRLTNEGNVGIGTATPTSALEVRGEIKSTDGSGNNRLWGLGRPGATRYGTSGVESGLCSNGNIYYGLSYVVTWGDNPQSACPAGTWVCTYNDRGAGVCNTARPDSSQDGFWGNGNVYDWTANDHRGWLSNTNQNLGHDSISEQGSYSQGYWIYNAMPVWCCSE